MVLLHPMRRAVAGVVGLVLLGVVPLAARGQHPAEESLLAYVDGNVWPVTGLPQSYRVAPGYWQNVYSNEDRLGYAGAAADPGRQQERFITQYGLNLYDGACYQIALSLSGVNSNVERAAYHTRRLLTNKTLQWSLGSRGYTKTNEGVVVHLYGDARRAFWQGGENHAFYFRMISELFAENDPLPGTGLWTQWQDWKPVSGENAWCGYIGPLQVAHRMWAGAIPWTDPAITIAHEMLDGVEAMQNEAGAIYHVPTGVSGKAPNEISNENNFSMYAAMRMFKGVLESNLVTGNLLRNASFETAGSAGTTAAAWQGGHPDGHGGTWGSAARHDDWGRSVSGVAIGAVHGLWDGLGWGGWWQEVPTRPGLTNVFGGWFWADAAWTAAVQEIKIEFLNSDNYIFHAVTNSFHDVGETWAWRSVQAIAPADAVWARAVIAVAGAAMSGSLQFDDVSLTASPPINAGSAVARVTNVMARLSAYFDVHLMNTNDGVFHTGGTYDATNHVFTPYVFSGYWIGGPYRGTNAFAGQVNPGSYDYAGTNIFNGYDTVQMRLHISPDVGQVNLRLGLYDGAPEQAMTREAAGIFTYTFAGKTSGSTIEYNIHPLGSLYGPGHAWTVATTQPPQPYTSVCSNLFAVDCQTWGMAVLGADGVDSRWGEGAAYEIWQKTKRYGGFFRPERPAEIRGVGFSDINNASNDVCSAEWSFGAILMCRVLANDYRRLGRPDLAMDLEADADTMRLALEDLRTDVEGIQRVTIGDGNFTWDPNWSMWTTSRTNIVSGAAYLYANKRHEIPFGWWANPLPSMASTAWAVMSDRYFNPFELGGGEDGPPSPLLRIRPGEGNAVTVEAGSLRMGGAYRLRTALELTAGAGWTNEAAVVSNRTMCAWSNLSPAVSGRAFFQLIGE